MKEIIEIKIYYDQTAKGVKPYTATITDGTLKDFLIIGVGDDFSDALYDLNERAKIFSRALSMGFSISVKKDEVHEDNRL